MTTKLLIICVVRVTIFHPTGPEWTLLIIGESTSNAVCTFYSMRLSICLLFPTTLADV